MTATKKIVLGLVTIALFSVCLTVAIPFGVKVPAYVGSHLNSPAFWPTTLSAFLIFLGALQLAAGIREASTKRKAEHLDLVASVQRLFASYIRVVFGIILLAGYYVATVWLGMVLASMLAITAFMLAYGVRRPFLIASVSIVVPLVLYAFFVDLAHLPLPMGIFS